MTEPSPAGTQDEAPPPGPEPRQARRLILGAVVIVAAVAVASLLREEQEVNTPQRIVVPELAPLEATGQAVFAETCATCHGELAQGSDQGPPLVHPIYRPAVHADGAFTIAVQQGVRAHHWRFGDMPPQPGAGDEAVPAVTAYVRALQRANGIR